ncbi:hypothetical protein B1759_10235 [Rubrivirga sp. SAORIC476]|uniref:hypothetical protein n=1 Tax=Rubrivirga sp. SAORIC476 TaxID=1961794 RepID=UPI000BA9B4AE|nr:hypothetical protein [Rubrivirga sp. SAORIC476]PAP81668.1 hypothetical protein B1759_10235 [Rubrivirga sp. SAORIC476]
MTPQPAGSTESYRTTACRLADAIHETALGSVSLDPDALDAVVGGSLVSDEVYRAAADFLVDWRADSSASA